MFRKKTLDKMMHPDSLDQLLVVVTPSGVFTLATLALILVIALIWSLVARVPVTVDGSGILLKPRSLKTVQATAGGMLTEVMVAVGHEVKAGESIAKVDQAELDRQLEQEIAKYKSTREYNEQALALHRGKRQPGEPGGSSVRQLQHSITGRLVELSSTQNANLEKSRQMLTGLRDSQRQQLKNITELVAKGIASEVQRLNAQAALNDTETRLAEIDVRIKQNEMSRLDAEQQALRRTQELEQQDSQIAAGIRVLKERLHRQNTVRTQFRGRILEVGSSVGQVITAGQRVFIMQIEPQEPFYRVELGADASRGSFVLMSGQETTAPLPHDATAAAVREALSRLPALSSYQIRVDRHVGRPVFDITLQAPAGRGGGRARPRLEVRDADLVSVDGIPTFATVFELGDAVEAEDLKHLGFFPVGPGKRVQPGMAIRINPTNVERQRFGSIMGVVTKVSEFPVTTEGVVNLIGNTDVAKSLLEQGGTMLIEAEMTKDSTSPTGLKWTSKGPEEPVTAGTTTTCRITLEERAPITFAIPLLRKWLLGDADKPVAPRSAK